MSRRPSSPTPSITTAKLADAAVTTAKLADAAVTTAKLADAAVNTGKIANGAVNSDKVGNDTLRGVDLGASGTFVLDIPNVPAANCALSVVQTGNSAVGSTDVVTLTPDSVFASTGLSYSAVQGAGNAGFVQIVFCNPSAGAINPGSVPFTYLATNP